MLCEVFSSPHLCHCPLRTVWSPPYRTMFPGEVVPLVEEKVRAEGWRDGRGAVVMEGDRREHPCWKYYHFSTKHQPDPPLVSFTHTHLYVLTVSTCYCVVNGMYNVHTLYTHNTYIRMYVNSKIHMPTFLHFRIIVQSLLLET